MSQSFLKVISAADLYFSPPVQRLLPQINEHSLPPPAQTARPGEPLPVVLARRLELGLRQRLGLDLAQRLELAQGGRPLPAQVPLPAYFLQPKGGHVGLRRRQAAALPEPGLQVMMAAAGARVVPRPNETYP